MPGLIEQAAAFAADAHQGQVDKAGLPYITHPARVAAAVAEQGLDDEAVAAAWLHDVVEDCDVSLDKIAERFGRQVAHLVSLLTRAPEMDKDTYYERLRDDADQRGVAIKRADIADNLAPDRVALLDPGLADRLREKYRHALRVLSGGEDADPSRRPGVLSRPPSEWQVMGRAEKVAWASRFMETAKGEQGDHSLGRP